MSEPQTKKLKTEQAVKKPDAKEEEEEEEKEEEGEIECEECGRILDMLEAVEEQGCCLECCERMRADNLRARLPDHMAVRKVSGNHRKPCSGCGGNDWGWGDGFDWYVFDASQPWGTEKFCLECAENRFSTWAVDSDEDY